MRSAALWVDVAVKALFVGLLAFGAFSGLEQFEGKAFGWRLATYPIAAALVPVGWWLAGRPRPYPFVLDILVVAPFLVDVLGNVFDLYDTIVWWDDLNHFVNWGLLSLAVGLLVLRWHSRGLRPSRWSSGWAPWPRSCGSSASTSRSSATRRSSTRHTRTRSETWCSA